MAPKRKPVESLTKATIHRAATVAEHSASLRKLLELWPDVHTVVDADKELMLNIGAEDIAAAEPGNPANCAIAAHLRLHHKEVRGAMIGREFGLIIRNDQATRYKLGKVAQIRSGHFDTRGTMEEGLIVLGAIPDSARLGRLAYNRPTKRRQDRASYRRRKVKASSTYTAKWNRDRMAEVRTVVANRGFRTFENAKLPRMK